MNVDWTAIRRRLERADEALARGNLPTDEEKKRVLRARAHTLARESQAEAAHEQLDVIEFVLAHERYAVEAACVREVYPLRDLTPLPGTPPFIAGIINVRGQILSVVDLKKFFDLPPRGLPEVDKVIILHDGAMEFGLLVDALPGQRRVPVAQIQPPLPTLTGIRLEYLRGVTADRLIVLAAERLLADPNLIVRQDSPA